MELQFLHRQTAKINKKHKGSLEALKVKKSNECLSLSLYKHLDSLSLFPRLPEPVFGNNQGAQETIPRNRFRQPM
jgi:hypothetical protein